MATLNLSALQNTPNRRVWATAAGAGEASYSAAGTALAPVGTKCRRLRTILTATYSKISDLLDALAEEGVQMQAQTGTLDAVFSWSWSLSQGAPTLILTKTLATGHDYITIELRAGHSIVS